MDAREQGLSWSGPDLRSAAFGNHGALTQLRKDGWTVRIKNDEGAVSPLPADSLARAIRAALTAYRRASKSGGEPDLPCRAALRAYQRIRPADAQTSERIMQALLMAIRKWPNAFIARK